VLGDRWATQREQHDVGAKTKWCDGHWHNGSRWTDEPDPNIVNPAAAAETGLCRSADAKAAPPTPPPAGGWRRRESC